MQCAPSAESKARCAFLVHFKRDVRLCISEISPSPSASAPARCCCAGAWESNCRTCSLLSHVLLGSFVLVPAFALGFCVRSQIGVLVGLSLGLFFFVMEHLWVLSASVRAVDTALFFRVETGEAGRVHGGRGNRRAFRTHPRHPQLPPVRPPAQTPNPKP